MVNYWEPMPTNPLLLILYMGVSCTNVHHVTDLVNQGMIKNTKT